MSLETLDRAIGKTVDMSVGDIVAKYPSKQAIVQAFQRGEILDEAKAVMAGMMIDRIAASAIQPPTGTVKDEVFAAQESPAGLAAAQQMQGQPQPQAPGQGIDQIPVPDQMFAPQGMAGGGIVAFSSGNLVRNPRDKTTAYFQSLQDFNPSEFRGVRGAELSSMMRDTRGLKVDPITGNPISLGEFLRAVDSGRIQIPEDFSVAPTAPSSVQTVTGAPTTPTTSTADLGVNRALLNQADMALRSQPAAPQGPLPPPPPPPLSESQAQPTTPGLRERITGRLEEAYQQKPGTEALSMAEDAKKLMKEREEVEEAAGVDKSFFQNEAKRIVALSDQLKGDRNEAANMRLIEAGLRIMGGESPYAFVNIGKGASEALKGFADDIKDIQKTRREYDKAQRDLRVAEQTYLRTKSDDALKEVQRRRERAEDKNSSFQKAMADLDLKLEEIGLNRERLAVQRQQVAQGASSPIERIASRIRAENPNLTYEQSVQRAFAMQQEPKTRAALEKEFLENPALVRQYGTYDNYIRAQGTGAGTNYKEKYGLE